MKKHTNDQSSVGETSDENNKENINKSDLISDNKAIVEGKCKKKLNLDLDLIDHLLEDGEFTKAVETIQEFLKIYETEEVFQKHAKILIGLETKLGEIFFLQGRFDESHKCHSRALELGQKDLDADSIEIANSYCNIGKVLSEQKCEDTAFGYFEKCLSITRKISPSCPLFFSCIASTARLFRLQGKKEQSFNWLNLANENWRFSSGQSDLQIAEYCREKGLAYAYKNRFSEAEKYLEKALDIEMRSQKKDSVYVALTYLGFGEVYLNWKNAENAHKNLSLALSIFEKNFGVANYQVARCYDKIGLAFQLERKFQKSFENLNKALKIRLEHPEEIRAELAESYYNIGGLYSECGSPDQTLESFSQSLDIYLEIFGLDSVGVAACYQNIANIYSTFGDDEKAIEYFELSIKIRADCKEQSSIDAARCYHNLGQIYTKQGKVLVSLEHLKKAASIYKTFGNSPDLGLCYLNIGTLCEDSGVSSEDLENYENALDVFLKCLGETHPLLAETYNRIGALKFWRAEYLEATENYKKAIKITCEIYGPDHYALAPYYNNLAMAYCRLKNVKAGFSAIKKCLKLLEKNNKVPYKDMSQIYQTLGSLFEEKKFSGSAVDCYKKASVIQSWLQNEDPSLRELIYQLEKSNIENDWKLGLNTL